MIETYLALALGLAVLSAGLVFWARYLIEGGESSERDSGPDSEALADGAV